MNVVALLLQALMPLINTYAFEGLQKGLGFIDRLPALLKAIIAAVLPIFLNMLANWLGLPMLGEIHTWTASVTLGILEGLVSIGLHEKQKQAALNSPELHPLT